MIVLVLGLKPAPASADAQIREYPLGGDVAPVGITAGPDGNIWYTESLGEHIGKINSRGKHTSYHIPGDQTYPLGITAAPDGNLWFTEYFGAAIGRITVGGSITEFPIPISAGPGSITAGSDGNLWFTELTGNSIGRMTLTGGLTEYPLPTTNAFPQGITLGPDGNVWFTEQGVEANNIGRITPDGTITEFSLPTPDRQPAGITLGPRREPVVHRDRRDRPHHVGRRDHRVLPSALDLPRIHRPRPGWEPLVHRECPEQDRPDRHQRWCHRGCRPDPFSRSRGYQCWPRWKHVVH